MEKSKVRGRTERSAQSWKEQRRDVRGGHRVRGTDQAGEGSSTANDFLWLESLSAELPDTGISGRLAQLLTSWPNDQRMVKEIRRNGAAKLLRELYLPSRRSEQVGPAYDECDALTHIVNDNRELIGPVAIAIAEQRVPALRVGRLLDWTGKKIVGANGLLFESDPHSSTGDF